MKSKRKLDAKPLVTVQDDALTSTAELERYVLGTILIEPTAIDVAVDCILPIQFASLANATIYEAMLQLHDKQCPIDLPTLIEQLKTNLRLESVGGILYVSSLLETTIPIENIPAYCKMIQDKYVLRELLRLSNNVQQDAAQPGIEPYDLLNDYADKVSELNNETTPHLIDPLLKIETELDDPAKIERPIPCGYSDLSDILWGFRRGSYYILAARPSVGKTAVALNMMWRIIDVCESNVMVISLEQSAEDMERRLLSIVSGIDGDRTQRGDLKKEERDRNKASLQLLRNLKAEHRYAIIEPATSVGMQGIKNIIKREQKKHRVDLVIIDQLSHLKNEEEGKTESLRVETLMKSLKIKQTCKQLNIPIILIVQIRRMDGKNERPSMSELKESGALEENADVVMVLWRPNKGDKEKSPEEKRYIELIVDKNRHGKVGSVMLTYQEFGLQITPVQTATTFKQPKKVIEPAFIDPTGTEDGDPF